MARFARYRRVFYIEEPHFDSDRPHLRVSYRENGLRIVTPHLPPHQMSDRTQRLMAELLEEYFDDQDIQEPTFWYSTPMALGFSRHFQPAAVIFDCMDELSAFRNAPPELLTLERELIARADLVFTGGYSLFEAKRHLHPNVHAFPSSVDVEHFSRARMGLMPPSDQARLPDGPKFGFFGVIDERMDLDLLGHLAYAKPNWQIVILGPVVKIDPMTLPRSENIHYLGMKSYAELPHYLSGWDVALLPFALNDSTRFISPTKTPEYLVAGKPVVSTPIRDVVRPYGENQLVRVAADPEAFVRACEQALDQDRHDRHWLTRVDNFLGTQSWDQTWSEMARLELKLRMSIESRQVLASHIVGLTQ